MKQYFLCWYTLSTLLNPSCCFPVSTSKDYISSFCHNIAQADHGCLVPSILFPEPLFPETQNKIIINVQIRHSLGLFYDSRSRSCFPDGLQWSTSNLIPGITAGVVQLAQGKDCKFCCFPGNTSTADSPICCRVPFRYTACIHTQFSFPLPEQLCYPEPRRTCILFTCNQAKKMHVLSLRCTGTTLSLSRT